MRALIVRAVLILGSTTVLALLGRTEVIDLDIPLWARTVAALARFGLALLLAHKAAKAIIDQTSGH